MNLLRLTGLGRLPPEAVSVIRTESQLITCEHIWSSITYRKFRSPNRACNWKRQWFAGSIVVSNDRLIAFCWSKRLINTQFSDPRFAGLKLSAENNLLMIAHDASLYRDDWSGIVEYRFRTHEAARIVKFASETARGLLPPCRVPRGLTIVPGSSN